MSPENTSLFRQKAPSQIIDWALNTPQKYQKLLYANERGTVNTYAKIKSMRKLVWSNSSNNYSQMFPKKLFLDFWGNVWRSTASRLERYYRKTSNMFSCDLFEITRNFCSTRGTTAISCPLSYNVYCVVIDVICKVDHCQLILTNQYISISSLWYRISFSLLVGSFFQP